MTDKEIIKLLSQEKTQNGLMQSFFESLRKMFSSMKKNIDVDEIVISQGQTEEEKDILRDICDDIHAFNANFRELRAVKQSAPIMTNAKWLEKQMEIEANNLANALEDRVATEEEKTLLKNEFVKSLDEHIEWECKMLNNDTELISSSIIEFVDSNKEGYK